MLNALKKLFGIKAQEKATAPYKVEEPKAEAKPAKKPAVKKATTKPRKPRAPKA